MERITECKDCGKKLSKKELLAKTCVECEAKSVNAEGPQPEVDQLEGGLKPPPENLPTTATTVVRPGEAVRDRFKELLAGGKITTEVLATLSDKEGSKACGVRYAFVKEFNPDVPLKDITFINGAARYSSTPKVEILGKTYLITNDIYKTTVPKFFAWADELGK